MPKTGVTRADVIHGDRHIAQALDRTPKRSVVGNLGVLRDLEHDLAWCPAQEGRKTTGRMDDEVR